MKYINNSFQKWLKELFISDIVNLYPIHKIKENVDLGDLFEIDIKETSFYRNNVISKNQGYLLFNDRKLSEAILNEFIKIATVSLKNRHCTSQGIANYLILIDRFGSLTSTEQYDTIHSICNIIPDSLYIEVVYDFVEVFNKEYNINTKVSSKKLLPKEWKDLMFSVQYLDHLNNPIELLRWVINFGIRDIPLIEIIHKLKPNPRVSLMEYGLNFDVKNEDMLKHLKENTTECSFYTSLITQKSLENMNFLTLDIAKHLIIEQWRTCGSFLFREVFGNSRQQLDENVQKILSEVINEFFIRNFSVETNSLIISELEWPNDFIALGGWLKHNNEKQSELSFKGHFINNLSLAFNSAINQLMLNLPFFINEEERLYHEWFNDPFDTKTQHISSHIMWSIEVSSSEIFEQLHGDLKKLFYKVKMLYYGSYTSNLLAIEISNKLMCLFLTYPNINDDSVGKNRFIKIMDDFIEIIGFQWIKMIERNDLIWNHEKHNSNYSDTELIYILQRLKNCPEEYKKEINLIISQINSITTTKWPLKGNTKNKSL